MFVDAFKKPIKTHGLTEQSRAEQAVYDQHGKPLATFAPKSAAQNTQQLIQYKRQSMNM